MTGIGFCTYASYCAYSRLAPGLAPGTTSSCAIVPAPRSPPVRRQRALAVTVSPFEGPVAPSKEYLTCLLQNAAELVQRPPDPYWDKLSKSTRENREKLLKQDEATGGEHGCVEAGPDFDRGSAES